MNASALLHVSVTSVTFVSRRKQGRNNCFWNRLGYYSSILMGDKGREAERETWDNSIEKSGKRDAWRLSTKLSTVVRPNLRTALVASVIDVFFFWLDTLHNLFTSGNKPKN